MSFSFAGSGGVRECRWFLSVFITTSTPSFDWPRSMSEQVDSANRGTAYDIWTSAQPVYLQLHALCSHLTILLNFSSFLCFKTFLLFVLSHEMFFTFWHFLLCKSLLIFKLAMFAKMFHSNNFETIRMPYFIIQLSSC